jgi:hypothetical protein
LKGIPTKKVASRIKYLGEFEAVCEMALVLESGPKQLLFNEKPRVKNLVTLSL